MDDHNAKKMAELHTVEKTFVAHDFVCHDTAGVFERHGGYPVGLEPKECKGVQLLRANTTFYNRILATDRLRLKEGAKVILLKNVDLQSDKRLVNGSVGTIIRWASGPQDMNFDSHAAGGAGVGAGPASPTKGPMSLARRTEREHMEQFTAKWLKQHPTSVPIVRE